MSKFLMSTYTEWGQPLRVFTDATTKSFYISIRDFANNVGNQTIATWGDKNHPADTILIGTKDIQNEVSIRRCSALSFPNLRRMTTNTDMQPRNKERAESIIKWLEPKYDEFMKICNQPALSDVVQKQKEEYRELRNAGVSPKEALNQIYGVPEKRYTDTDICANTKSVETRIITVDDFCNRMYELTEENKQLHKRIDILQKKLADYEALRDMFLSISGKEG